MLHLVRELIKKKIRKTHSEGPDVDELCCCRMQQNLLMELTYTSSPKK